MRVLEGKLAIVKSLNSAYSKRYIKILKNHFLTHPTFESDFSP